jgi:hypothetical protein
MLTTILDLIGIACLAAFAFFVWPPACLGVIGLAALAVSRKASR